MQEKRFQEIRQYLREHDICTYEELCQYCDVSLSTMKRDVQYLANAGEILRIRGGAKALRDEESEFQRAASMDTLSYEPALDRIAKRASQLVNDNEIIFLGSGVTVAHMVKHLRGYHNLTVITNSIYVMQEAFQYDINVMMIGGMLNRATMSYIGIQSVEQLRSLNANRAFMSCNGIALSHGVTNSSEVEGDVKKVAINVSRQSVLLADSNKFGKISLHTIAQLGDFSCLITDKNLDEEYLSEARAGGTEVMIVSE